MTQLQSARNNKTTTIMREAAKEEAASSEFIRRGISRGRIVLPANKNHRSLESPCAIGAGLSTKVNANIGTSEICHNILLELKKLKICIKT